MKTLVDRLHEAYQKAGFKSYAELSRAAGLRSASTVYDLFRGHLHEESAALVPLAAAMNVNAMWLQRGKGPMSGSALAVINGVSNDEAGARAEIENNVLAQSMELQKLFMEASPAGRMQILRGAQKAVKRPRFSSTDLGTIDDES